MKKLYKSIRDSFILLSVLSTVNGWAKPGALVTSLTGNVFVLVNGATKALFKGNDLNDNSEIITEEGALVTLSDYYDHKYHLSGSAHIKMFGGTIELVQGYMWVQSYSKSNGNFLIQSANALISYTKGEAIISFDPYSGKTQVYSLEGKFEISNILKKDYIRQVGRGEFSFVSNDYENGIPRRPTELSQSSYDKIRGLFRGVDPLDNKQQKTNLASNDFDLPTRNPASVKTEISSNIDNNSDNKIIYLRKDTHAEEKIRDLRLENYYTKITQKMAIPIKKKKFKPTYSTPSNVAVKIYGQKYFTRTNRHQKTQEVYNDNVKSKTTNNRMPASVSSITIVPTVPSSEFENSLVDEYKKQMRHSNEINQLINELKNYDQDYKSNY